MADNGNNKWIMWLAGILATIFTVALPTGLIANVVKNDRIRASEDTRIEAKYDGKIDKMVDIVTDMRIEQRGMVTILKRLDK